MTNAVSVDFDGNRPLQQGQRKDQADAGSDFNYCSLESCQRAAFDAGDLAGLYEWPWVARYAAADDSLNGADFFVSDGGWKPGDAND